jgi:hypothetical protein
MSTERLRGLTQTEIRTIVDLAYDVFEEEAKETMGAKFKIHDGVRAQYYGEVSAMYEKIRRGDVVRKRK